ncbi:hypothetical protein Q8A73_003308 [Channa argus]|nr:hypothetical protein Q8A73_003308 [Channa argus]
MQLLCLTLLIFSAVVVHAHGGGRPGTSQGPPHDKVQNTMNPGPKRPDGNPGKQQGQPLGARENTMNPGSRRPDGNPGNLQEHLRGQRFHNNHGPMGDIDLTPQFKVDNVTFQNTTAVLLKEGVNIYLKLEVGD